MGWRQPVCENRYRDLYPGREPYRLRGEGDPCCYCLTPTTIYVRLDPATVPYPLED